MPQSLSEATRVFERHSDERGLARVARDRAFELWGLGRMAEAATEFDSAASHADHGGLLSEGAFDRAFRLVSLSIGPATVEETLEAADAALASVSDRRSAAELRLMRSTALASVGRLDEARVAFREGLAILLELGHRWWAEGMGQLAAFIERQAGDLEAARELLEDSVRAAEAIGERAYSSTTVALLADVLCELGRFDEAIAMSQVSQDRSSRDDVMSEVLWRSARGRGLAAQGRAREADALADRALELITATDMVGIHGDIWRHVADMHSILGRAPSVQAAALTEAARLYGAKGWLVERDRIQKRLTVLEARSHPPA
jgi:tetratricopeptide (TPR) repeat protein